MENNLSSFLSGTRNNALTYAPTQVGKTVAIGDWIETHPIDTPILLSCDNKTDQLEQLLVRLQPRFQHALFFLVHRSSFLKQFRRWMAACPHPKQRAILLCLDNAAQVQKVYDALVLSLQERPAPLKRFTLIHDEGDVITKDENVDEENSEQCQSHRQWIKLIRMFGLYDIDWKRIFVTATPENVVYKYPIGFLHSLPVPKDYIGGKSIQMIPLPEDDKVLLVEEQNRRIRHKEPGIILYCVERKTRKGHDQLFHSLCDLLPHTLVHTYNSHGIRFRIPATQQEAFAVVLRDHSIVKEQDGIYHTHLPIATFYQLCKGAGCLVILTIGMDLMTRGMTFVSERYEPDALAATTLIYRPGASMHAVGAAQVIGRITGTARPDLQRRLYASPAVLASYQHFLQNQEQIIQYLSNGLARAASNDLMSHLELNHRLDRPLDRSRLKLRPVYKPVPVETTAKRRNLRPATGEKLDGVRIDQLEKWTNHKGLIGKMIRCLFFHSRPIPVASLMEEIEYPRGPKEFRSNIENGGSAGAHYGKLWIHKDQTIVMNPVIRGYLKEKNWL